MGVLSLSESFILSVREMPRQGQRPAVEAVLLGMLALPAPGSSFLTQAGFRG